LNHGMDIAVTFHYHGHQAPATRTDNYKQARFTSKSSAGFNKGDTSYRYVQICVVFVCLLSSLLFVSNAAIYSPRGDISISCFNMLCPLPVLAHSSRDI
jgi:hypothetical protein